MKIITSKRVTVSGDQQDVFKAICALYETNEGKITISNGYVKLNGKYVGFIDY